MNKIEIIKKLNQFNNFHLSLKVICFNEDEVLNKYASYLKEKNKNVITITNLEESYALLLKSYNQKNDYVLVNQNIDFVLPLVSIITNEDVSIIKPTIPVKYHLKDNKVIQKVKTTCHKKMTNFTSYKKIEDLFNSVYEEY